MADKQHAKFTQYRNADKINGEDVGVELPGEFWRP